MIFTPALDRSSAACWAPSAGTASTPTMMFVLADAVGELAYGLTVTLPMLRPTFSGSVSKTAAMLMPCSAKIGELAIAWPRRPAPTRAMLCCPCVRRILRISPSSESML